jgi:hypothetical protein
MLQAGSTADALSQAGYIRYVPPTGVRACQANAYQANAVKPTLSNQRLSSVTLVRSAADAPARRRVTSTFSSTTPSGLAWPAPDFKVLVLVRLACFESRVGYRTRSKMSSSFCIHSLRARTGHQTATMEEAFGKSFAKAQQLHGVSLSSFIASVSLSAVMFTIEVLVFLAIRKRFPDL